MRLIDADKLKEKLIKIQANIIDKKVQKGSSVSDAWKAAYLLVFDEYIKMVDEMPSATQHYDCNHDCDAIYEAYDKGYSKGRENVLIAEECMKKYCETNRKMEEQAKKQMEDYCKNDCDTTNKIWKAIKMTKDELWSKVIKDLKTLDQKVHDEEFVPLITAMLVMTACELRTDIIHGTIKQEDKFHMWSLVDDLGCYSIKGETIMYLPVYQELTALMRKVF